MATARSLLNNLENLTAEGSSMSSSLENVQTLTGRMSGKYGLLSGVLGDDEARKFVGTLERLDALLAKTDRRLYGKKGIADDAQAAVVELQGGAAGCARHAQESRRGAGRGPGRGGERARGHRGLGALRGEVDASLRKVNRLVDEINRKWPFAGKTEEIKLP
nr:hypothetical protein [Massilia sp. Se16.2.3]